LQVRLNNSFHHDSSLSIYSGENTSRIDRQRRDDMPLPHTPSSSQLALLCMDMAPTESKTDVVELEKYRFPPKKWIKHQYSILQSHHPSSLPRTRAHATNLTIDRHIHNPYIPTSPTIFAASLYVLSSFSHFSRSFFTASSS
jgi:predicted MPP superfamily phosphohydrolase